MNRFTTGLLTRFTTAGNTAYLLPLLNSIFVHGNLVLTRGLAQAPWAGRGMSDAERELYQAMRAVMEAYETVVGGAIPNHLVVRLNDCLANVAHADATAMLRWIISYLDPMGAANTFIAAQIDARCPTTVNPAIPVTMASHNGAPTSNGAGFDVVLYDGEGQLDLPGAEGLSREDRLAAMDVPLFPGGTITPRGRLSEVPVQEAGGDTAGAPVIGTTGDVLTLRTATEALVNSVLAMDSLSVKDGAFVAAVGALATLEFSHAELDAEIVGSSLWGGRFGLRLWLRDWARDEMTRNPSFYSAAGVITGAGADVSGVITGAAAGDGAVITLRGLVGLLAELVIANGFDRTNDDIAAVTDALETLEFTWAEINTEIQEACTRLGATHGRRAVLQEWARYECRRNGLGTRVAPVVSEVAVAVEAPFLSAPTLMDILRPNGVPAGITPSTSTPDVGDGLPAIMPAGWAGFTSNATDSMPAIPVTSPSPTLGVVTTAPVLTLAEEMAAMTAASLDSLGVGVAPAVVAEAPLKAKNRWGSRFDNWVSTDPEDIMLAAIRASHAANPDMKPTWRNSAPVTASATVSDVAAVNPVVAAVVAPVADAVVAIPATTRTDVTAIAPMGVGTPPFTSQDTGSAITPRSATGGWWWSGPVGQEVSVVSGGQIRPLDTAVANPPVTNPGVSGKEFTAMALANPDLIDPYSPDQLREGKAWAASVSGKNSPKRRVKAIIAGMIFTDPDDWIPTDRPFWLNSPLHLLYPTTEAFKAHYGTLPFEERLEWLPRVRVKLAEVLLEMFSPEELAGLRALLLRQGLNALVNPGMAPNNTKWLWSGDTYLADATTPFKDESFMSVLFPTPESIGAALETYPVEEQTNLLAHFPYDMGRAILESQTIAHRAAVAQYDYWCYKDLLTFLGGYDGRYSGRARYVAARYLCILDWNRFFSTQAEVRARTRVVWSGRGGAPERWGGSPVPLCYGAVPQAVTCGCECGRGERPRESVVCCWWFDSIGVLITGGWWGGGAEDTYCDAWLEPWASGNHGATLTTGSYPVGGVDPLPSQTGGRGTGGSSVVYSGPLRSGWVIRVYLNSSGEEACGQAGVHASPERSSERAFTSRPGGGCLGVILTRGVVLLGRGIRRERRVPV
ncbi:hypothetical protein BDK51DRAFT_33985 [Blyttiomyces helicus]|uniref:Uncharacterized protein n=1 Tax=Blyttiomyces helicus TaxID=388810 RepID=A0A4P9WNL1_9FUNG|nr:hypothetical protein BDK51DRAFT_33985 [Blyttiomyces helicus]|eukprot:RKO94564.1 hypothetical protein BDK51DRAFT_33985 [Blyttiomyces helicus]